MPLAEPLLLASHATATKLLLIDAFHETFFITAARLEQRLFITFWHLRMTPCLLFG